MDYKEYLLKQDAINLQYIANKMWPGNSNAKSYLSTKLNGTDIKRPWTEKDNELAKAAIHELGLQLIKDAPITAEATKQPEKPVKKETTVINKPKSPVKKHVELEQPKKFSLKDALENAMKEK